MFVFYFLFLISISFIVLNTSRQLSQMMSQYPPTHTWMVNGTSIFKCQYRVIHTAELEQK